MSTGLNQEERMKRLDAFADHALRKIIFELTIRTGENQLDVTQACLNILSGWARQVSPVGTAAMLRAIADQYDPKAPNAGGREAARAYAEATERMRRDLELLNSTAEGRA